MAASLHFVKQGQDRWVSMDQPVSAAGAQERCDPKVIEKSIAHLGDVRVTSAAVNTSGRIANEFEIAAVAAQTASYLEGLPPFCDVRVEVTTPGGHVARVIVWVPLEWNERFLGTGGSGMRTTFPWMELAPVRIMTLPVPLRNGFATASTDAGIRDPRPNGYALNEATHELDWELLRNWSYRSTHDMTVVGKAVTEAIHGIPPRYSYFSGCSGGGRQAMAEAQLYPGDYDGIWSTDPAINWTKFVPAALWPPIVMKELGNVMPPAKLEVFRAAAVAAGSGADGMQGRSSVDLRTPDLDPHLLVGTQTPAGAITTLDAEVIKKIWEGPRGADGEFLWYGLRPEAESWGANLMKVGLEATAEADGKLIPQPFSIALGWVGAHLFQDPQWDWNTISLENFSAMFERSVERFSEFATDDPDLSQLRDNGGKVILTHTTGDQIIFPQGTVDYFRRVQEAMGGQEATAEFIRLFMGSGSGHGFVTAESAGATIANTMIALMRWVEEGVVPDEIPGEAYDLTRAQVVANEPIPSFT